MIYCFDIDGTISERPDVWAPMMKALKSSGHTVFPLTAMVYDGRNPYSAGYEEMRISQLKSFGLEKGEHYDDVVVCVGVNLDACGELKGKFCKENGVAFMVEDTGIYAAAIKKESPMTLCVRMPNGL